MIHPGRYAAEADGDFVVFLIGMRFNKPWKFWKWLPIVRSMPTMIKELATNPESGFISAESWFGRTVIMVQYWRSTEDLIRFARDRDSAHLPAWKQFNQMVGKSEDVGIWHETYQVKAGAYEAVYANMPRFGLAKAFKHVPATGRRETAKMRLGQTGDDGAFDQLGV